MAVNEETLRLVFEAIGSQQVAGEVQSVVGALGGLSGARTAADAALEGIRASVAQLGAAMQGAQKNQIQIAPPAVEAIRAAEAALKGIGAQSTPIHLRAIVDAQKAVDEAKAVFQSSGLFVPQTVPIRFHGLTELSAARIEALEFRKIAQSISLPQLPAQVAQTANEFGRLQGSSAAFAAAQGAAFRSLLADVGRVREMAPKVGMPQLREDAARAVQEMRALEAATKGVAAAAASVKTLSTIVPDKAQRPVPVPAVAVPQPVSLPVVPDFSRLPSFEAAIQQLRANLGKAIPIVADVDNLKKQIAAMNRIQTQPLPIQTAVQPPPPSGFQRIRQQVQNLGLSAALALNLNASSAIKQANQLRAHVGKAITIPVTAVTKVLKPQQLPPQQQAQQPRLPGVPSQGLQNAALLLNSMGGQAGALGALISRMAIAQSALSAFGSALGPVGTAIAGVAAGVVALGTTLIILGKITANALRDAGQYEQATIRLGYALRANGTYSEQAVRELQAFADVMQKTRGVTDESVMSIATLLTQLGGLAGDKLQTATARTLDLAAALGIDLQSAALLMAKAAEGNTVALARYGIRVSDTLAPMEKFQALLDLIDRRFKGAAIANIQGFAGSLNRLKVSFFEINKQLGTPLLGGFASTVNSVSDALDILTGKLSDMNAVDEASLIQTFQSVAKAIADTSVLAGKLRGDVLDRFKENTISRLQILVSSGNIDEAVQTVAGLEQALKAAAAAGRDDLVDAFTEIKTVADEKLKIRASFDAHDAATFLREIEGSIKNIKLDPKLKVPPGYLDEVHARADAALKSLGDRVLPTRIGVLLDPEFKAFEDKINAGLPAQLHIVEPVKVPEIPPIDVQLNPTFVGPKAPDIPAPEIAKPPPGFYAIWAKRFLKADEAVKAGEEFAGGIQASVFRGLLLAAGLATADQFKPKIAKQSPEELREIAAQAQKNADAINLTMKLDLRSKSAEDLNELLASLQERLSAIHDAGDGVELDPKIAQQIVDLRKAVDEVAAHRDRRIDFEIDKKAISQIDTIRGKLDSFVDASKTARGLIQVMKPEDLAASKTFDESLARLSKRLGQVVSDTTQPRAAIARMVNEILRNMAEAAQGIPERAARIKKAIDEMATAHPELNIQVNTELARAQIASFDKLIAGMSSKNVVVQLQIAARGLEQADTTLPTIDGAQMAAQLDQFRLAKERAFATGDVGEFIAALKAMEEVRRRVTLEPAHLTGDMTRELQEASKEIQAFVPQMQALATAADEFQQFQLSIDTGDLTKARLDLQQFFAAAAKAPNTPEVQRSIDKMVTGIADAFGNLPVLRDIHLNIELGNTQEANTAIDELIERIDSIPELKIGFSAKEIDALKEQLNGLKVTNRQKLDVDISKASRNLELIQDQIDDFENGKMTFEVFMEFDFKKASAAAAQQAEELRKLLVEKLGKQTAENIADAFVAGTVALFQAPFQAMLDKGVSVAQALGDAFKQMVASILAELAKMAALNFLLGIFGGGGFIGGAITRALGGATTPAPVPVAKAQPAAPKLPGPLPAPTGARATPRRLAAVTPDRPVRREAIEVPAPLFTLPDVPVLQMGVRFGEIADSVLPPPQVKILPPKAQTLRLPPPRTIVGAPAPTKIAPKVRAETPGTIRVPIDVRAAKLPTGKPVQINPAVQAPARAARAAGPALPARVVPIRVAAPRAPVVALPQPRRTTIPAVQVQTPRPRALAPVVRLPDSTAAIRELTTATRQASRATRPRELPARGARPVELPGTAAFSRERDLFLAQSRRERPRTFVESADLLGDFLPRQGGRSQNNFNIRTYGVRDVKQSLQYGELGDAMRKSQGRR